MKAKRTNPPLKLKNRRKAIFVGLVAIGLVSLAGYLLIWQPYQIRAEKARFETAASELEKLHTKIMAGKFSSTPTVTKTKECNYDSQKYERGPLSCTVKIEYLFYVNNADEATAIMNSTHSATGGFKLKSSLSEKPVAMFVSSDIERSQVYGSEITDYSNLDCYVSYQFPYTVFEKPEKEILSVGVVCTALALTEHYKVGDIK